MGGQGDDSAPASSPRWVGGCLDLVLWRMSVKLVADSQALAGALLWGHCHGGHCHGDIAVGALHGGHCFGGITVGTLP